MVDLVVVVADDIDQLLEAIVILVREATIVDDVMVVKELLLVLEIVDDAIVDVKLLLVFLEIQTLDLQVDHHDLKVRHLRLVLIADQAREIGNIQKESKTRTFGPGFFYHHLIYRPNLLHYR